MPPPTISELTQAESDALFSDVADVVIKHSIRKALKETFDMGTVDPPDTVAGPSPDEIKESMLRSDGKMPDGVNRLPHNATSYQDGEVLSRQGIIHVDLTDGPGAVTDSFPIEVVRYVEIRGFQVWEAETRQWGYVGYVDNEGQRRFRAGFIRLKCEPGTNGTPELPVITSKIKAGLESHDTWVEGTRAERAFKESAAKLDREAIDRLLADVKNAEPALPQGIYAQQILDTVTNRGNVYGHPSVNHQLTADLWSQWLSRKTGKSLSLSAEDVCILNILQKLSRLGERSKDDTCLDVMGYMENVSMLLPEQRNHGGAPGSTGAGVS